MTRKRRVVVLDRPMIIDALKRILNGESTNSVALSYNVHYSTVVRWCRKAHIALRGTKDSRFNWGEIEKLVKGE